VAARNACRRERSATLAAVNPPPPAARRQVDEPVPIAPGGCERGLPAGAAVGDQIPMRQLARWEARQRNDGPIPVVAVPAEDGGDPAFRARGRSGRIIQVNPARHIAGRRRRDMQPYCYLSEYNRTDAHFLAV
jgi:hypothetical protein